MEISDSDLAESTSMQSPKDSSHETNSASAQSANAVNVQSVLELMLDSCDTGTLELRGLMIGNVLAKLEHPLRDDTPLRLT